MAQIITATAEPDQGRVRLLATGGTPGEAFYVVRKDLQGSNLIRETTGIGVAWAPDPASVAKNLFKNPALESVGPAVDLRRNFAVNPEFRSPNANIAAGWAAYSSGTVTGNRSNNGSTGQILNTTSIANGAKYGISAAQTFTATTRRVVVAMEIMNGIVDNIVSANTVAAKIEVDFKSSTTIVQTKSVTLPNWGSTQIIDYTGGLSINNVAIRVFLENNTGATVATPQRLMPQKQLLEITNLDLPIFSGSTPAEDEGELGYVWTGTVNNSASVAQRASVSFVASTAYSTVYSSNFSGNRRATVMANGLGNSTYAELDGGPGALRLGMVANKSYTARAQIHIPQTLTGAQSADGRMLVAVTKIGAGANVVTRSNQAPNAPGVYDLAVTFNVPAGATEAYIMAYNGSGTEGELVHFDQIIVAESSYVGPWFDGRTPNAVWDGTPDNSTSTITNASLPITMYDYEARQGFTATYTITNESGVPDASDSIDLPKWGTWLKDPFRPFMNCRVLWHADSDYVRAARREKLWARGAKFPVFHSDQRSAPSGTIMVATETEDQGRALTAMLDRAQTIMVDVDSDFGVPVRYVDVGDVTGSRAGSDPTAGLTWEARLWTLQIDEVAMPIGAPVNQNYSYDQLASKFGSYVAIPATVPTYEDLAAGMDTI